MKTIFCLIIVCLIETSSCRKDESVAVISTSSKLLVKIKEKGHTITGFKYDSLNRLIQLNEYFADTFYYSEFYKYDSVSRLSKRIYGGFIETYKYNSDGKLLKKNLTYPATEKKWDIEYQYNKNNLSKGIVFYNGIENGYIDFKYDSNGNTVERTEYFSSAGQNDLMLEQFTS